MCVCPAAGAPFTYLARRARRERERERERCIFREKAPHRESSLSLSSSPSPSPSPVSPVSEAATEALPPASPDVVDPSCPTIGRTPQQAKRNLENRGVPPFDVLFSLLGPSSSIQLAVSLLMCRCFDSLAPGHRKQSPPNVDANLPSPPPTNGYRRPAAACLQILRVFAAVLLL